MKREFDFEEVGKKVPYQLPADFFEKMQDEVLTRVNEPENRVLKSSKKRYIKLMPSIIAVAAVLSAVVYIPLRNHQEEVEQISQASVVEDVSWIEDMSDEDLQSMSDFTDCDIFMK